jgi:transposase-like protein
MAISKNNPAVRDNQKLVVCCPLCNAEMLMIKRIPGGMHYVCQKDGSSYPVSKGSYKEHKYAWVKK